ncbi:MAG: hypothetical protein M3N19_06510 [Candidatus Eremiobacteraeota bacterium]|nr:hypothetical protein [Candidatus Eremiobacteraeota bacterium]
MPKASIFTTGTGDVWRGDGHTWRFLGRWAITRDPFGTLNSITDQAGHTADGTIKG